MALRFVSTSLLGIVGFFALTRIPFVSHHLVYPYTEFIATVSRFALRVTGHGVGGDGLEISGPRFSVLVQNVCNGLEVTGIFLAAVFAFPTSFRNKLIGVALGYPVIFVLNVARIAALYLLGFHVPNVFETVHRYYAQALVIILTLLIWMLWVTRFTEYGTKARRHLSP